MNPPTEDLIDYIDAQTALTKGVDLFTSVEPTTPDNCVTLYDSPGNSTSPKFPIEMIGLQVRSRGDTYKNAYQLCHDIKILLEGLREDLVLNGSRYFGFYVTTQPTHMIRDKSERHMFTMNIQVQRNPADVGNRV